MQTKTINIKKRKFLAFLAMLPIAAFAQGTGLQGISSTAEGLGNYIPVMQGLCFALAAVTGIAGSLYAYYQVQKGNEPQKYVMVTVGSAMTFVLAAIFLPHFFGYSYSINKGGIAQNVSNNGNSSSDELAHQPSAPLITEIPDPSDPRWEHEVNAKMVLENYGGSNNNNPSEGKIDLYELYSEYTSHSKKPDFDQYINDAIILIERNNYDFNAATAAADADYWSISRYFAEHPGETAPYGPSEYYKIFLATEYLQTIIPDVTYWRYAGNIEPPPSSWVNAFW